jgi:heterotetrameric sarcosine oxidase delta subunit
MLLTCPFCGLRDHAEYEYGGDASVRLMPAGGASAAGWIDHVYLRDNPRGAHAELWFHGAGCQQWLRVLRDTFDNRVLDSRPAAERLGDRNGTLA